MGIVSQTADEVSYRRATLEDVEALIEIRLIFLAEVVPTVSRDPAWLAALRQFMVSGLPSEQLVIFIAEAGGQMVGTGWLLYQNMVPSPASLSGRDGLIFSMYTAPAWRRRGIGCTIVRKLLDVARTTDCRRVILHAVPEARQVYARAGFEAVDSEMRIDLRLQP
jgi:GNAT superfamily N-acetyltransferase